MPLSQLSNQDFWSYQSLIYESNSNQKSTTKILSLTFSVERIFKLIRSAQLKEAVFNVTHKLKSSRRILWTNQNNLTFSEFNCSKLSVNESVPVYLNYYYKMLLLFKSAIDAESFSVLRYILPRKIMSHWRIIH